MSGRDRQLPRGDREDLDEKPLRPEPEPEIPLSVPPPKRGGFGTWLKQLDEVLSEDEARQAVIDAGGF